MSVGSFRSGPAGLVAAGSVVAAGSGPEPAEGNLPGSPLQPVSPKINSKASSNRPMGYDRSRLSSHSCTSA